MRGLSSRMAGLVFSWLSSVPLRLGSGEAAGVGSESRGGKTSFSESRSSGAFGVGGGVSGSTGETVAR